MDDLNVLVLISRWVHISFVIIAIGGVFFQRLALLPAAAKTLDAQQQERLREAIRARWARLVHVSIALILLTGGYNFTVLVLMAKVEPMPYHAIFGIKLLAALLIFFLASALVGKSEGFAGLRRAANRWLSVILVLAGLIVLLSGVLSQIRLGDKSVPPVMQSPGPEGQP